MEVLAQASNKIAEGEVHQLQNCHNPDISEKIYFEVIYAKTAKLFEAACHVPGVLAGANQNIINSLINFGKYLGTAFQIMDDIIDYSSCHETSGKNMGDDLAEGKTTLPLIIALEHSKKNNLADYQLLRHAIKTGDLSKLEKITDILNKTNALDSTKTIAKKEADKAEKNIGLFIQNPTLLEPLQALCKMTWDRIA